MNQHELAQKLTREVGRLANASNEREVDAGPAQVDEDTPLREHATEMFRLARYNFAQLRALRLSILGNQGKPEPEPPDPPDPPPTASLRAIVFETKGLLAATQYLLDTLHKAV